MSWILRNWQPVLALLSFIISMVALYFAHLKGPVLELATSSDPLEIENHGERNGDYQYRMTKDERIVIASIGINPGILYSVEFEKIKHIKHIEPYEMDALPRSLDTGQEFPFEFKMLIDQEKTKKGTIQPEFKVLFRISRSLGRKPKQKRETIKTRLIN